MSAAAEYGLALSYLNLYKNEAVNGKGGDNVGEVFGNQKLSDVETNTSVWEHFEWTHDEQLEVQQSLKKLEDRCQIDPALQKFQVKQDDDAWNGFYSHHATSFFKDRHYLHTAFPHEFGRTMSDKDPHQEENEATLTPQPEIVEEKTLVEVGCGVGNALLPLLEEEQSDKNNSQHQARTTRRIRWTVHGLDLSSVAIALLKNDPRFLRPAEEGRAYAYVANIVQGIPSTCHDVADVASLLFCLSAIDPTLQATAINHVVSSLKPEGVIVFRDYGRWDESQVKLGSQRSKRLKRDFYQKNDGTKCYFFSTRDLRELFEEQCGLEVVELEYINRIYKNRATDASRRRVWVHGRFRKR